MHVAAHLDDLRHALIVGDALLHRFVESLHSEAVHTLDITVR
jgi:hypothetical protein